MFTCYFNTNAYSVVCDACPMERILMNDHTTISLVKIADWFDEISRYIVKLNVKQKKVDRRDVHYCILM